MPHLHLETTADVPENADIPDILDALCRDISQHPTVDSAHVRAYHSLRSVWVMGEGAKTSFVHLTVHVLSGREESWKQSVGESLMSVLQKYFAGTVEANEANLSLEVREMDRATYKKFP